MTPPHTLRARLEARIDRIVQRVAEMPDRTSPEDWPEAMLVTSKELHDICADELSEVLTETAPADDLEVAALLCERWGMITFKTGVRAHVPSGKMDGSMVIVTPESLKKLVARLRAETPKDATPKEPSLE